MATFCAWHPCDVSSTFPPTHDTAGQPAGAGRLGSGEHIDRAAVGVKTGRRASRASHGTGETRYPRAATRTGVALPEC